MTQQEREAERVAITAELQNLEQSGMITPDRVVRAARRTSSAMHHRFQWDDSRAARAYRIEQARELIRSIHFTVLFEDRPVVAPVYVRSPQAEADSQGYSSVQRQLQGNPELSRIALNNELARVLADLSRAETLALVLGLQEEVRTIRRRVESFRQEINPSQA